MCPNICKGEKRGCFVGFSSKACSKMAECFATYIHLMCLSGLLEKYKSMDKSIGGHSCLDRVKREIAQKPGQSHVQIFKKPFNREYIFQLQGFGDCRSVGHSEKWHPEKISAAE